jgi:hypothetical protein
MIALWKNPIYFGVIRSKVKVTITINIIFLPFDNLYRQVMVTFNQMTPKLIGFFPFYRGIMWPSLVKIRYTELKLLCGNLCERPPTCLRSKVKVIVTINRIVDYRVVSA